MIKLPKIMEINLGQIEFFDDIEECFIAADKLQIYDKFYKMLRNGIIFRLPIVAILDGKYYCIDGRKLIEFYKHENVDVCQCILIDNINNIEVLKLIRISLNVIWKYPHEPNLAHLISEIPQKLLNDFSPWNIQEAEWLKLIHNYDWSKVRTKNHTNQMNNGIYKQKKLFAF